MAFVSPHFTDLIQPPRANATPIALPALPSADPSGSQATEGAPAIAPSSGGPGRPQAGPDTAPPPLIYNLGYIDTPYTHQGGFPAGAAGGVVIFNFSTVANGSTLANGTSNDGVSLSFNSLYGYLDLYLYNSQAQLINSSTTGANGQSLSLAALIPGSYQLQVFAYGVSTAGVPYSMSIDPPAFVPADAFGGTNDTAAAAANFGLLSNTVTIPNLTLDSTYIESGVNDVGWYKFQTTAEGTSNDYVAVDFDPSQAPVFLALYDSYGNFLGVRDATGVDTNGFGLAGGAAQIYYVAAFTGPALGTNSDYSLNFVLPPPIPKDQYSSQPGGNATFATAADLITPNSNPPTDVQTGLQQYGTPSAPLTIDTPGIGEWFKFRINAGATSGDFARIDFNALDGQLFLGLADAGEQILSTSTVQGNTEEVSLGYLPQGTYYLFVAGAYGATNPGYLLTINAPAGAISPDRYYDQAPNNTFQTASALGPLSGDSTIDKLTIFPGDVAWYTFSTTGTSTSANYVGLNFDPSLGLIDAELLISNGNVIGRADDASYFTSDLGVEARMSLQGEPAGSYYIVVYGLQGATSPDYALHFFLPASTPATSPNDTPGSRVSLAISRGSTPSHSPHQRHSRSLFRSRSFPRKTTTTSVSICRKLPSRATT